MPLLRSVDLTVPVTIYPFGPSHLIKVNFSDEVQCSLPLYHACFPVVTIHQHDVICHIKGFTIQEPKVCSLLANSLPTMGRLTIPLSGKSCFK